MKISVITCTGRMEPGLEKIKDCLNNQTVTDFEWVIVDRVVHLREPIFYPNLEMNAPFPIQVIAPKWSIYHDHNMPAIANARNSGLVMAKGELIIWIDDNMWFPPDYLERHLKMWEWSGNKPYYMVGVTWPFMDWDTVADLAKTEPYDETGKFCRVGTWEENVGAGRSADDHRLFMEHAWYDGIKPDVDAPYECIKGSWCYSGNMSHSLSDALSVNGFDEECDGAPEAEDIDFGTRMDNFGCRGLFDRHCVVYKYRNPNLPSLKDMYPYTRGYIGEVNGTKLQRCEYRIWAIMKEKSRIRANAHFDLNILRENADG